MLQQREIRRHVRETLINIQREKVTRFLWQTRKYSEVDIEMRAIISSFGMQTYLHYTYRNLIILLLLWLWPAARVASEKLSGSFSVLLETD